MGFEAEVFMVRMPFLSPNQQHQSTEGKIWLLTNTENTSGGYVGGSSSL